MFTGFLLGAGSVLAVLFGWNVVEDAILALRHRRKRLAEVSPLRKVIHTSLSDHNDAKKVNRLLKIKR